MSLAARAAVSGSIWLGTPPSSFVLNVPASGVKVAFVLPSAQQLAERF